VANKIYLYMEDPAKTYPPLVSHYSFYNRCIDSDDEKRSWLFKSHTQNQ